MRNLRLFCIILSANLFFALGIHAQSPAKWDFKTKKINDSVAELVLHCKLSGDWHIYSQHTKGTELPIAFTFEKSNAYENLYQYRNTMSSKRTLLDFSSRALLSVKE